MADGTVRGTFDLNTSPARRELRSTRREAQLTDRSVEKLGRTMDRVGGRTGTTRIREYRREVRGLAKDVQATSVRTGRSWDAMERKTLRSVEKQTVAVRGLRHELAALGRDRATPTIDLAGITRALAQVDLLDRKLRQLDRRRARPGIGGLGGGGLGGGGLGGAGGGGGRGFIRSLDVGPISLQPRAIAGIAAVGLPAVRALTGAVVALAGSLGQAALGFGALGTAAASAGAVGLGSIAAIAVPATARIKEAYQAQTQFTQASQQDASAAQSRKAAANSMRSAEDALAASQRQSKYAQEALTQARRDARRELVDMALAADRSRLSERRASIELRRARQEARRVENDPQATQIERDEAQLGLQEARLGLRESRVQRQRAVSDSRQRHRGGVQKMPEVVAARRQLADARRSAVDARRQVSQAAEEMAAGATSIANAKQKMDEAFARAPQGTKQLITDIRELRRLWGANDPGTAPGGADPRVRKAQSTFVGFLGDQVQTARNLTPTLGAAGLRSTRALRREGRGFDRFLESGRTKAFIRESSAMFDENARQWRRTTQFIFETMMNVTRASRPFLREASDFMAHWTGGWARSTRDTEATRRKIGQMVGHLKSWLRLIGAAGRLTKDLFGAGAPEGKSAVDALTQQLNVWDMWVKRNPRQVRDFFKRTVDSTVSLARSLGKIAGFLSKIGELLTPILDKVTGLINLLGDAGLLTPGAGLLAFSALSGIRGRGRGGAAALGAGGLGASGLGVAAAAAGAPWALRGGLRGGAGAMYARYRAGLGLGLGRVAALRGAGGVGAGLGGGLLRGAGAGIARRYLPVGAALAGLDAYSFDGDLQQKLQAGASSFTLGAIPRPKTDAQNKDRGSRIAADFAGTPALSYAGISSQQRRLRTRIIEAERLRAMKLSSPQEKGPYGTATASGGGAEGRTYEFHGRKLNTPELNAYIAALRKEYGVRQDITGEMKKQDELDKDTRSRIHAGKAMQDIGKAFDIRSKAFGPEVAMKKSVNETLKTMRSMRPAGAKILSENTLAWARQQARSNPALWGQVRRLEREIKRSFSRTGQHVEIVNGKILTGSKKEWSNIRDALASRAEQARQEVHASFTAIQREAVGSLMSMGISKASATKIVSLQDASSSAADRRAGRFAAQNAADPLSPGPYGGRRPTKRALGGRAYRLPGRGLQDTVPMADGGMGAPGELVIARHTERRLNQKLLKSREPTTVAHEVGAETREHSKPFRSGPRVPRFKRRLPGTDVYALGGSLNAGTKLAALAAGGSNVNLMGASPGLAPYAAAAARFGLRVTSGARPGSITSSGNVSLHASNDAIDVSNGYATPQELRYARWMAANYGRGLDELIHTPLGFGIKNGARVAPYAAADHYDHVHVGDRTPSGGARGLPPGAGQAGGAYRHVNLKGRRSKLGGIPGAMSTRASEIQAAGLELKINRKLDRMGAVGGDLSGFSGGGSSKANMMLGHRMMLAFGYPESEWPSLRALWQGESGWQNVMNTAGSGATGIPQALPGSKMASAGADWRTNPATQIKWGLGYIRSRYRTPSAAYAAWLGRSPHWYASGGRLGKTDHAGAFRRGGHFRARGPTTFMAGEEQASGVHENVHVERVRGALAHRGGGGGARQLVIQGPLIKVEGVSVSGQHDLNDLMGKAADHAAKKLLAALKGVSETPDTELVR